MAQDSTLHIKIEPSVAESLRRLAKTRRQTVGELVRRAIATCYQVDQLGLTDQQRQAMEAYRGGFISIGKLSEIMGRSVLDMRPWLNEHGIEQNVCFGEADTDNA